MISKIPTKDWEKFGKEDPYFGVLSDEAFKKRQAQLEGVGEVRRLREEFIAEIFATAYSLRVRSSRPKSAWILGVVECGGGRLVIAGRRPRLRSGSQASTCRPQ